MIDVFTMKCPVCGTEFSSCSSEALVIYYAVHQRECEESNESPTAPDFDAAEGEQ